MIAAPMSRLNGLILAAALLGCATFARAESLQLVAPAERATLRGGSFAALEWSASQLPPSAEEWEAFLSIDGGKYYAFRITPHFDIDLRRVTFLVPNVDARNARILIRTGNEVQETHFPLRRSFSIVRDPAAERVPPRLLQFRRGESARQGDPPVLAWAEGARNGSGITQQATAADPSSPTIRPVAGAADASPLIAPSVDSLTSNSEENAQPAGCASYAASHHCRAISVDLLLLCMRRNV